MARSMGQHSRCVATWGEEEQCEVRQVVGDGLCNAHYKQRQMKGFFTPVRTFRPFFPSTLELARWCVEPGGPTRMVGECQEWQRALKNGYPAVRFESRQWGVHRLVAQELILKSPLPLGSVVHHKCSNRCCILLDHLAVVTPEENTAEMFERRSLLRRIGLLEEALRRHAPPHVITELRI